MSPNSKRSRNNKKKDFLDECLEFFGSKDLYQALEVDNTATEKVIKSAYRKKSLSVHPDRATEDRKEHAKKAFQILTKIHQVLTSESARKFYDETGRVLSDDDGDFSSFTTFEQYEGYWRNIFPDITPKAIDEFLDDYIGSEEEKSDLIKYYLQAKGDLDIIYQYLYAWDEERVAKTLNQLIESGEVPEFDAFVNEPKSKKQKRLKNIEKERVAAEKEKKRLEKKKKKKSKDEVDECDEGLVSLQLAIKSRGESRFGSMIADMEVKYGGRGTKKLRKQ